MGSLLLRIKRTTPAQRLWTRWWMFSCKELLFPLTTVFCGWCFMYVTTNMPKGTDHVLSKTQGQLPSLSFWLNICKRRRVSQTKFLFCIEQEILIPSLSKAASGLVWYHKDTEILLYWEKDCTFKPSCPPLGNCLYMPKKAGTLKYMLDNNYIYQELWGHL